jgi:hypothetical protein
VERRPAYAPELNPVEGLWSSRKATELANLTGPTLGEVIAQAQRGIQRVRHTAAPGLFVPAAHRPVGVVTPRRQELQAGGRLAAYHGRVGPVVRRSGAMTRSLRRIDWAALGTNLGSAVLFTLLLLGPFLVGAHYRLWLLGLTIGVILGLYFYLRRERYREPGPDADETRFPP